MSKLTRNPDKLPLCSNQVGAVKSVAREGVYKVDGGWKHRKDANRVWKNEVDAATDYRFCKEWEA